MVLKMGPAVSSILTGPIHTAYTKGMNGKIEQASECISAPSQPLRRVFCNIFSFVGASTFLPFLPMLPIQGLTNNFLYDFSQTTIPTDEVMPTG